MKKLPTPKILVLLFLLACAAFPAACRQEEENKCLDDDITHCQNDYQDCLSALDILSANYVEEHDSCVAGLCYCFEAAGCVIDDTFDCGD